MQRRRFRKWGPNQIFTDVSMIQKLKKGISAEGKVIEVLTGAYKQTPQRLLLNCKFTKTKQRKFPVKCKIKMGTRI